MKVIRYIKDNWFSWLVTLCGIVFVIVHHDYSKNINSVFLYYTFILIPIFIFVLPLSYYTFLSVIEENVWEELKIGKDPFVDKFIGIMKRIIILLIILTFFWTIISLYTFLSLENDFNIYKNIFHFIIPIIVTIYLVEDYYKLSKQYYN